MKLKRDDVEMLWENNKNKCNANLNDNKWKLETHKDETDILFEVLQLSVSLQNGILLQHPSARKN